MITYIHRSRVEKKENYTYEEEYLNTERKQNDRNINTASGRRQNFRRRKPTFCLLLGPPGFNCWFSFAPVFQWCCSTSQGFPGVGRNTFLSSPHLCFITVFICDLFVSRDDPLMI